MSLQNMPVFEHMRVEYDEIFLQFNDTLLKYRI